MRDAECGMEERHDTRATFQFRMRHSAFRIRDMGHARHRRFFVPPADIREDSVFFSPAQVHQLRHVLRLHAGDEVTVFDGTGREIRAVLDAAAPDRLRGRVVSERRASPWRPSITLAQVVPRGAAMDQIVSQATELGVGRLVPLLAARSVRQVSNRAGRWLRIVREAAEQCGRPDLPEVTIPTSLPDFLAGRPTGAPLVVCQPGAAESLLAACRSLAAAPGVTLLLGGEGGFTDEETSRLAAVQARFVSLGPRLLRAPTASLAAVAILQAGLAAAPGER
jgi:16S rRNA (uracil1498-N3)-methyltransferase